MGGSPNIIVPPAPVLPAAPDQSSVSVQQFGAMFRRRAATGYASTLPNKPEKGMPSAFHTDTIPGQAEGVGGDRRTDIVIDPSTGLPTETPHVLTAAEQATSAAADAKVTKAEDAAVGIKPNMTPEQQALAYRRYQTIQNRVERAGGDRSVM